MRALAFIRAAAAVVALALVAPITSAAQLVEQKRPVKVAAAKPPATRGPLQLSTQAPRGPMARAVRPVSPLMTQALTVGLARGLS